MERQQNSEITLILLEFKYNSSRVISRELRIKSETAETLKQLLAQMLMLTELSLLMRYTQALMTHRYCLINIREIEILSDSFRSMKSLSLLNLDLQCI